MVTGAVTGIKNLMLGAMHEEKTENNLESRNKRDRTNAAVMVAVVMVVAVVNWAMALLV